MNKKTAKPSEIKRPKDRKTRVQIEFGKIIKKKRLAQGLSQEQLAAKSGLHFTYLSSVERGERCLTISSIEKIANGLEVHMKELMPDPINQKKEAQKKKLE